MENIQHQILAKPFISISEFMQLFDISRATAQRLLLTDEINFKKLGGKVIIPTQQLNERFT